MSQFLKPKRYLISFIPLTNKSNYCSDEFYIVIVMHKIHKLRHRLYEQVLYVNKCIDKIIFISQMFSLPIHL